MAAKKRKSINLLPQEEFESSTVGRILHWALTSFRIMVILTEMVVMGAFMSRFWLDAKNSDLSDAINVAKAQVMAYSDIEQEFRLDQKKLAIAKSLYNETKYNESLYKISKAMPPDVSLVSLTFSGNSVQMKARSGSERSIAQFTINLENTNIVKSVELSQISSSVDNDNFITFTITAELMKEAK
jgi:Tfp pilus assembly protein PilN